ncbi:putative myomesin [Ixodes scapularis]
MDDEDPFNAVMAPSFLHKPTLRQEDDGNRLVFECQMTSHPRPDITWFRGDVELKDDHRTSIKVVEIEPRKYHVSLELNDVIETDGGLYKVFAKNKEGKVDSSINLNFSPADEPLDHCRSSSNDET